MGYSLKYLFNIDGSQIVTKASGITFEREMSIKQDTVRVILQIGDNFPLP